MSIPFYQVKITIHNETMQHVVEGAYFTERDNKNKTENQHFGNCHRYSRT